MKIHRDNTWTRRGVSLIWDPNALGDIVDPVHVVSLRELHGIARVWPDELPGNDGDALVVAGLEGLLDTLSPTDAEIWLEYDLKHLILDFQSEYEGRAALIFWLPSGSKRLTMSRATEEYFWKQSPDRGEHLPLGRCLWAGAESDAARILVSDEDDPDPDGAAYIGLYHPRLS